MHDSSHGPSKSSSSKASSYARVARLVSTVVHCMDQNMAPWLQIPSLPPYPPTSASSLASPAQHQPSYQPPRPSAALYAFAHRVLSSSKLSLPVVLIALRYLDLYYTFRRSQVAASETQQQQQQQQQQQNQDDDLHRTGPKPWEMGIGGSAYSSFPTTLVSRLSTDDRTAVIDASYVDPSNPLNNLQPNPASPLPPAKQPLDNPFSLLVVALMTSNKFLDDARYSNRWWSKISEMPHSELNTTESQFLKTLGFELVFEPREYEKWVERMQKFARVIEEVERSSVESSYMSVSPSAWPPKHSQMPQSPMNSVTASHNNNSHLAQVPPWATTPNGGLRSPASFSGRTAVMSPGMMQSPIYIAAGPPPAYASAMNSPMSSTSLSSPYQPIPSTSAQQQQLQQQQQQQQQQASLTMLLQQHQMQQMQQFQPPQFPPMTSGPTSFPTHLPITTPNFPSTSSIPTNTLPALPLQLQLQLQQMQQLQLQLQIQQLQVASGALGANVDLAALTNSMNAQLQMLNAQMGMYTMQLQQLQQMQQPQQQEPQQQQQQQQQQQAMQQPQSQQQQQQQLNPPSLHSQTALSPSAAPSKVSLHSPSQIPSKPPTPTPQPSSQPEDTPMDSENTMTLEDLLRKQEMLDKMFQAPTAAGVRPSTPPSSLPVLPASTSPNHLNPPANAGGVLEASQSLPRWFHQDPPVEAGHSGNGVGWSLPRDWAVSNSGNSGVGQRKSTEGGREGTKMHLVVNGFEEEAAGSGMDCS
ncbi:hypothetical protein HDV05_000163 [Chytridiales sp. JEL 0842]|nr:hypothetical protein HDV05_000163 [Chytridiales sp. JEL 0842]